jgi:hypothetical protein
MGSEVVVAGIGCNRSWRRASSVTIGGGGATISETATGVIGAVDSGDRVAT